MKSIPEQIKKFFRREAIPRNTGILAAVSGGPDSTALALGLAMLKDELGLRLELAYYDHGLRSREEARGEEAFVRQLGARLELPVQTAAAGSGVLRELAGREKKSIEALAREKRYAFLKEASRSRGLAFIAVGHTRSDRIETQALRFFQGSSAETFIGISGRRGEIIRPLIGVDRGDVIAFLRERGQDYLIDASNNDPSFLRNRLRMELIPAAFKVFPGFGKALDALAHKSRLYADFMDKSMAAADPWEASLSGWECSWEAFLGLHPLMRIHSVYKLCPRRGEKRIPFAFLAPLAKTGPRADGIILSGRGLTLVRRGDRLYARRDIVLNGKKGYFYRIDRNLDFCIDGRLRVWTEELSSDAEGADIFPLEGEDSLFLRSRRPGDLVRTKRGPVAVGRLFAEWKIDMSLRDLVPLVQRNGIIAAVLALPFGGENLRLCEGAAAAAKRLRVRISITGERSGQ